MARVIFLNRFYWPEEPATAQLLTDLAEALAAAGHDVTVIASLPSPANVPRRERPNGVTVLRVASTRWGRFGLPGKAVDFVTFYLGALMRLVITAQRGDRIVVLTDPPLIGVGAWLVARMCGARIFHWVQDIYPEIAAVVSGQSWLNVAAPLRNLAWRRADGCVALGSDMAATLDRAGVAPAKLVISPNWAPAGLAAPDRAAVEVLRREWQLEGKFVVAYSGNLGRVHDLGPVLEVAGALRDAPDIAFLFIGSGARRDQLQRAAQERGLTQVQFRPSQPRGRLAATLALGDLQLVTLLPGCAPFVFPSKVYGVAAVGRPVLFIGPPDYELARLVNERGFGRAFARGDVAAIAGAIRDLRANPSQLRQLGAAAEAFGRDHAGPRRAASEWARLLAAG